MFDLFDSTTMVHEVKKPKDNFDWGYREECFDDPWLILFDKVDILTALSFKYRNLLFGFSRNQ